MLSTRLLKRSAEAALAAVERFDNPDPYVELCVSQARTSAVIALSAAWTAAAAHYEESAKIAQSVGLLSAAAIALSGAASSHVLGGEYDRALPLAVEGLALARQLGAPWQMAWGLTALAGALSRRIPSGLEACSRERPRPGRPGSDRSRRTLAVPSHPSIVRGPAAGGLGPGSGPGTPFHPRVALAR